MKFDILFINLGSLYEDCKLLFDQVLEDFHAYTLRAFDGQTKSSVPY
jgi:hypothetical protein